MGQWPPDLRAKCHSRWDLLTYLAHDRRLAELRAEATADRDVIEQQRAEALAALHD